MVGPYEGPVSGLSQLSDRLGGEVGKIRYSPFIREGTGDYSFTAEIDGTHTIYAQSAGAEGFVNSQSNNAPGGSSGGFGRKTVSLRKGDTISVSMTNSGINISGPNVSMTLTAAGATTSTASGAVGTCIGGDINISGSRGGYSSSPAQVGKGEAGGAAGTSINTEFTNSQYGGAGAPGTRDIPGSAGTNGQNGNIAQGISVIGVGAGSGGFASSNASRSAGKAGPARVIILYPRIDE